MSIKKVLIVDDVQADLLNLQRIVAGAGVGTVTASDGQEAITKAKADRPDLIFMDVNMNPMDGFAATRVLQGDPGTKGIPVVFVTGKSQKADKMWAQMLGGKGFIAKPYTDAQILEQLKAF